MTTPIEPASDTVKNFLESFHITVAKDSFYQDVTLHLDAPHSLSIRLRNDSTKSWIFADLEERRRAALAQTAPAEVVGEPVAWQRRKTPNSDWVGVSFHEIEYFKAQGQEARALYTQPTPTQAEAKEAGQPRYTTARMKQEKAASRRLAIVACMDALQSATEKLGFLSVEEAATVLRALLKEGGQS